MCIILTPENDSCNDMKMFIHVIIIVIDNISNLKDERDPDEEEVVEETRDDDDDYDDDGSGDDGEEYQYDYEVGGFAVLQHT